MALVVKDRVRETTTTTGTGTITLGGAATGFQSFSVIGDANTTFYTIQLSNTNEWEVGIGTYTLSGTTLSRDTILESSNGGSAVNFSAGSKDVFVTYPAEKSLYLDGSNNAIGLGTVASTTILTNATGLSLTTGVTGTLPVLNGGTNQTSYTNGQLLIGNTTGNTLAKSTLTAGTGISVTNGSGSITIANSAPSVTWQSVQTTGFTAVANSAYPCNTTSAAFTVTLPASPSAGNLVTILDYAGTSATNNITINPNGNKIQGTTTDRIIFTNREAINLIYVDSTQGWLAYADVYSTTTPLAQIYTASYLILAGGGGGGLGVNAGSGAGGGGAGGYITGTISLTQGTVYTAVVGGGGAAGPSSSTSGTSGSNSTFTGLTTAVGGGGGGAAASGGSGGSGGGAGGPSAGGSGTPGQGNNGGAGITPGAFTAGGGGGGASAVGDASSPGGNGGNGGNGSASSITGSSVTYAGGGGGGGQFSPALGGLGGPGTPGVSGGNGGSTPSTNATNGVANTGGGGGGNNSLGSAGAGGSGVVILSVPTASYSSITTGSPTITTSGANTIIKYTSGSGTYTA